MQVQNTKVPKDLEIFNKEVEYRKTFFINWMKNKISSLIDKDIYGDFNKGKK